MTILEAIILLVGVIWSLLQRELVKKKVKTDQEPDWEKLPTAIFLMLFIVLSMTFLTITFIQGVFA